MDHSEHGAGAAPGTTANAADAIFGEAAMAAAREQMRREHGDVRWSRIMAETLEIRPGDGDDSYALEGSASFGGDINRFVLKADVEGASGVDSAEVEALWSRAVSPYFNLQAGVRHDFEPGPSLSHLTLGVEGLAPYWFEVGAAAYLSEEGDLSGRVEGSYDLRLTQRLILEPRAELNVSAADDPARGLESGLTDLEAGLRLRYALRPEIAPYIGVHYERKLGGAASRARLAGEEVAETVLAIGLRGWF